MGDLIEIKGKAIEKRIAEQQEEDDESPIPCPECSNVLYYVVFSKDVDEMIMVCQHCGIPMALAYLLEFEEE